MKYKTIIEEPIEIVMVNLYHPCAHAGIDVAVATDEDEANHLYGQGYVSLEELRWSFPEPGCPHVGPPRHLKEEEYPDKDEYRHYYRYDCAAQLVQDWFWYYLLTDQERAILNPATVWAHGLSYFLPWTFNLEAHTRDGNHLVYSQNFLKIDGGDVTMIGDGPLMWGHFGHDAAATTDLQELVNRPPE